MLTAAATVPTFLTAVASSFGTVQQKGTALGIFRSLGALARAFGPVVASFGKCYHVYDIEVHYIERCGDAVMSYDRKALGP